MTEKANKKLRQEAEKLLLADQVRLEQLNREELTILAHELGVHQIELEIQNEELRKSRLALETARDRYSDLYDFAPVSYFTLSPLNLIIEANLTGAILLGVIRSKLIGNRFSKYIVPDNKDSFYFWRKKVKATGEKTTVEFWMKRKDGYRFYASLEGIGRPDNQISVAVIDITQRKIVEDQLRESEERFHQMFEGHQSIMLLIDPETMLIIDANPAAAKFYGYPREVLRKMNINKINQSKPNRILKSMQSAVNRQVNRFVFRHRLASGEIRIVEVHSTPIIVNLQQILFSIIHDITEREEAEKKEAYLATFPELNPSPIVELTLSGEISYLNPSFELLFPEIKMGQTALGHPFFSKLAVLLDSLVSGVEKTTTLEIEVDKNWYYQTVNVIEDRIRIYGFDITESKKAGILKDEFIGMVSHELKTPMTVIIGALSTLGIKGISKQATRELLHDAVKNGDTMTNMIDNLLELSRDQAQRLILEINPTDIRKVVRIVVKKLSIKSDIHQIVTDIPVLPLVQLDPLRLERILYNLIDNAIKYSPDGGEVKIFARQQEAKIIIGVKDLGIGISHEDEAKLFQKFQRLVNIDKYSIKGIGLGLRVSQILVEALGGSIWVESEPNKGSTFFFTVPMNRRDGKAGS